MKILFINRSTLVPEADFGLMVRACAAQALFDLMTAWNEASVDVAAAVDDDGLPTTIPIVLFDDSDAAGALGYHDETPDGRSYGRVFTRETLDNGGTLWQSSQSVSVTMSHEMCEAIVDPDVNLWADDGSGTLYALEACDAVEGDAYPVELTEGELVAHVFVSDFLHPSWFDVRGGYAYDHMGLIKAPFELRPNGYTLLQQGGRITQAFASGNGMLKRASKTHPAARSMRRLAGAKKP